MKRHTIGAVGVSTREIGIFGDFSRDEPRTCSQGILERIELCSFGPCAQAAFCSDLLAGVDALSELKYALIDQIVEWRCTRR
jgi:hypothetical protein